MERISRQSPHYLRYERQAFTNALADFGKSSEFCPSENYAHFAIWLCQSKLGQAKTANNELEAYLEGRQLGTNDWPSEIGRFLIGKVTESELFKTAESTNTVETKKRNCEAYFYAGSKRLIAGDKTTAIAYFGKCLSTGAQNCTEYFCAESELQHSVNTN